MAYYEQAAGRTFRTRGAAVLHYLLVGSALGLRPHPDFDPTYYRQANPDVVAAGYEPFAHYLRYGRQEGRGGTPEADAPRDLPDSPSVTHILDSANRRGTTRDAGPAPGIDVVVPVYGNRSLTLAAIGSALAAPNRTAHEVVVVDDASPDRLLSDDLQQLADAGLVTLLRNERNAGFVTSVNRGMALHPDRDVVLLNSDTRVFGDWLDRLVAVLQATPRVGTATPLSNAATIVSYPLTLRDNSHPLEIDFAALDALCAQFALPPVAIPTAVGFCMAIQRRCLDDVGSFDVARFGRGYGEENDFCMRAARAGWSHLAAANVFVWHRGGASFGAQRSALIEAAQATIEELHPGYRGGIHDFIRRDPLKQVRATLDAARVAAVPRMKILEVGKGKRPLERRARDGIAIELLDDIDPYIGDFRMLVRDFGAVPNLPRLGAETPEESLVETIRALAIDEVRLRGPLTVLSVAERRVVSVAAALGVTVQHSD
jgi:GT2 family glycosyltransferase